MIWWNCIGACSPVEAFQMPLNEHPFPNSWLPPRHHALDYFNNCPPLRGINYHPFSQTSQVMWWEHCVQSGVIHTHTHTHIFHLLSWLITRITHFLWLLHVQSSSFYLPLIQMTILCFLTKTDMLHVFFALFSNAEQGAAVPNTAHVRLT